MNHLEREWWEEVIQECEGAEQRRDNGTMYEKLKKLGTRRRKEPKNTTITTQELKKHFSGVSAQRYAVNPQKLETTLNTIKDISNTMKAREANKILNEIPKDEEIEKVMKQVKDSTPGRDGARIMYIISSGSQIKKKVKKMVQYMFRTRANRWEGSLKIE